MNVISLMSISIQGVKYTVEYTETTASELLSLVPFSYQIKGEWLTLGAGDSLPCTVRGQHRPTCTVLYSSLLQPLAYRLVHVGDIPYKFDKKRYKAKYCSIIRVYPAYTQYRMCIATVGLYSAYGYHSRRCS